jgi:hypothetical protein
VLDGLAGLAGLSLSRDDHHLDAELFEFPVDGGLAVAAVGGGLCGHAAEPLSEAPDRRGELLGVGGGCRSLTS